MASPMRFAAARALRGETVGYGPHATTHTGVGLEYIACIVGGPSPFADLSAPMSASLSLQLLGAPQVWVDGVAQELPTRKLLALLAHLALCGGATRAQVVALLWSNQASAEGRRNLRQELHRLRATPLATCLRADEDRLVLQDGFQLDVDRWRNGLMLPAADLTAGPPVLLDGLEDIKGAEGFSEWL